MNNSMINKSCPICGKEEKYDIVYESNLPKTIDQANYAGRKEPDNYHYEMVRCFRCGLLFASSIYNDELINQLYKISDFNYKEEVFGLKLTYKKYIKKAEKFITRKERMLDVGCGNGFVLEVARDCGWENFIGVEPSMKAIKQSALQVKGNIIQGVFNKDNFVENSFDLVFSAMVLEHLIDINEFLEGVNKVLKPGGIVIGVTHDERHIFSRILKNKHPIINDEHVCVYSSGTLKKIFIKHNYIIRELNSLRNIYSIKYWLKMIPIFKGIINIFINLLQYTRLLKINMGFKAGNIYIIAQKPN